MTILTIADASKVTGMSTYELKKGAKEGRYPHIKTGKAYLFEKEMLEEAIRTSMMKNMKEAH